MKIAHTVALGVALGSLATAGVAQDARSAGAMPAYTPASAPLSRGSAHATDESDMHGSGVVLAVLAIAAIIAAIIIAASGGNDSPG
ncbi:MAG: hypothetical protein ACTHKM_00975 [Tsuneonella sp.]